MAIRVAGSMQLQEWINSRPGTSSSAPRARARPGARRRRGAITMDRSRTPCWVSRSSITRQPASSDVWHVRDYGLFAANPFCVHDFEKKPRDR